MSGYFKYIDTDMLDKKLKTDSFPFSRYLFWDSEVEDIDIKSHKKHIIERVLTRGFLKDVYILLKLYTHDELVTAIKSSRILDKKTASFCSQYFNIPLNEINASSYHS